VRRLVRLARVIAPSVGANEHLGARAALLAKADLTTGMVGEFPELQGVMGGYYAGHDGEDAAVCQAVRDHYAPKGASDNVPSEPLTIAVALADKLDQLAGFFVIGQKPSGSGDPYALRRAALGVVRIIRENGLRIELQKCLVDAAANFTSDPQPLAWEILRFITDRLRVQLRSEGARHDVLDAVFAASPDDDFVRALARTSAIENLLKTDDGRNLLAAYKRASNILRIEDGKDGPHHGRAEPSLFRELAEHVLYRALEDSAPAEELLAQEKFSDAMQSLATLRTPLDSFFENVTVNAVEPELRINRLYLLYGVRWCVNRVADFSKIEST
jgi:glycyl-tRNA synthetase beta chain